MQVRKEVLQDKGKLILEVMWSRRDEGYRRGSYVDKCK